jgi:hypothetical protein
MSYPQIPCAYCNQPGHKANRCKELGIPPDGEIIKPLPGQNDVDEEEDSIVISIKISKKYQKYTKRLERNLFRTLISTSNLKINTSRPICVFR